MHVLRFWRRRTADQLQARRKAARTEAKAVIQRWNDQLALGRDMLWSPTIRAALIAGNAMARRALSRLQHKPRHRSPHPRSPSARLGRNAGARLAVWMVSGLGADAEVDRAV